jgi:hypothetical protein
VTDAVLWIAFAMIAMTALDLEDARIRHAADSAAGNGFREI